MYCSFVQTNPQSVEQNDFYIVSDSSAKSCRWYLSIVSLKTNLQKFFQLKALVVHPLSKLMWSQFVLWFTRRLCRLRMATIRNVSTPLTRFPKNHNIFSKSPFFPIWYIACSSYSFMIYALIYHGCNLQGPEVRRRLIVLILCVPVSAKYQKLMRAQWWETKRTETMP